MASQARTHEACLRSAVAGLYAGMLPEREPSFEMLVTRALSQSVDGTLSDLDRAIIRRRAADKLGISVNLLALICVEGIL